MAHVLAVDDYQDTCQALARLLKVWGHEAACAYSGEEALAYVRTRVPDVLLLDVMMPGVDGIEVLRRLKADPKTAGMPVLMYSASSDGADELAACRLGAAGYIVKSRTPPEELRRRVEAAASLAR